jgi:hypothetical protein
VGGATQKIFLISWEGGIAFKGVSKDFNDRRKSPSIQKVFRLLLESYGLKRNYRKEK